MAITLAILIGIICIAMALCLYQREGFARPEILEKWLDEYHTSRLSYLNDLIKADYIQSYPWMAAHPNQLTTAAEPEIIGNLVYRPLNYYDYGEITYIGNSL